MAARSLAEAQRRRRPWAAVFQSATCVGTLLDRLCHRVEVVQISGESWRVKEANDPSGRGRDRVSRPR